MTSEEVKALAEAIRKLMDSEPNKPLTYYVNQFPDFWRLTGDEATELVNLVYPPMEVK